MFERLTERARVVVVLAQEEARKLKHPYIGTEHMLMGLIREEEGLAARVLEHFDVTEEKTRAAVVAAAGEDPKPQSSVPEKDPEKSQLPFTAYCKKVLDFSLREALPLGHNYIGTEHILLGLVRLEECRGATILRDSLGVTGQSDGLKTIRDEIVRMLSGPGSLRQERSAREDGGDLDDAFVRSAIQFERRRRDRGVTRTNRGSFHVRHRTKAGLRGYLVDYDWESDRCTVELADPTGEVEGRYSAPRVALVVDARPTIEVSPSR